MPDERDDGAPATPPRRLRVPAAALLLALGAAAFAALYVGAAAAGPTPADAAALSRSVQLRGTDLTTVAVVLTNAGSTVSMAVLALLAGGWCLARGRTADAALAVGAMLGGVGLFRGIKLLLDRARPPEPTRLVMVTNESLPSGHATMSMVVIGTLVALAWTGRSAVARAGMVAAAAVWVGAVGATRVYLGVHWFTDVVAGWLVGATWLTVCVVVWSWWARRASWGRVTCRRTDRAARARPARARRHRLPHRRRPRPRS